jgi:hypothetical protein
MLAGVPVSDSMVIIGFEKREIELNLMSLIVRQAVLNLITGPCSCLYVIYLKFEASKKIKSAVMSIRGDSSLLKTFSKLILKALKVIFESRITIIPYDKTTSNNRNSFMLICAEGIFVNCMISKLKLEFTI